MEKEVATPKTETKNEKVVKEVPTEKQIKDLVNNLAIQKALSDESLARELTEKKRQELLNTADNQLKTNQAESRQADVAIQEAEFGVFKGVAEYAGIKHALPLKMQQIIFSFLSILQGIFFIILGSPISIINIAIEQIDSVVVKLNSVAKSVKRIVVSLLIVGVIAIAILIIYQKVKGV